MVKKRILLTIFILILMVSGGVFAFRSLSASAREMKLVKTDGKVHVSDEMKQEKHVKKNMNLYNGYGVGTETDSYAWIDLDKTKLLKLDESSSADLEKDGRKLRVRLVEGDLFFCVTERLGKDEELEFENSNTAMSIRGTTGIFRSISDDQSQLVLMEGSVELKDGQTVTTGQVADLLPDRGVSMREIVSGDVPNYVLELIEENKDIKNKILSGGGRVDYMTEKELLAIYGDLLKCYRTALSGERMDYSATDYTRYMPDIDNISPFRQDSDTEPAYETGLNGFKARNSSDLRGWRYAFFDINHDGYPELLIADHTLGEGYGIRDIWTTDGAETKQVHWPPNSHNCWKITANGSVAQYEVNPHFDYRDVYYYTFDPASGQVESVAHTDEGSMGRPAWAGVVYDESNRRIFETESKEEFDRYIADNFPPVLDLSLNWRSFD